MWLLPSPGVNVASRRSLISTEFFIPFVHSTNKCQTAVENETGTLHAGQRRLPQAHASSTSCPTERLPHGAKGSGSASWLV